MDRWRARQSIRAKGQEAMGGLVCLQNGSGGVGGDDGGGTAFDQHLELLLGLSSRLALPFDLVQMAEDDLTVLAHLINKQSDTEERREVENVARRFRRRVPGKRIEELGQDRAEQGNARRSARGAGPGPP